jgi:hypothetical protein
MTNVSEDGEIVGDAKFYTLVEGERLPPAKFSTSNSLRRASCKSARTPGR